MRHLIVARYNEPLTWLSWLLTAGAPYMVTVVNNGSHRPNEGREAGAYLWWILRNYERLHPYDLYAFVQADPFPHCEQIVDRLQDQPGGWQPLGDWLYESDGYGGPHHPGLPVQATYGRIFGEQFTGTVKFYAGGQFMCRGSVLLNRPRSFYERLSVIANDEANGGPWVLERLWARVFGRDADSHHRAEGAEVTA